MRDTALQLPTLWQHFPLKQVFTYQVALPIRIDTYQGISGRASV